MGTHYNMKMELRKISGANVTMEEISKIADILNTFGAKDVLGRNLVDVGKWDWKDCLATLCKAIPDMVFMVVWSSERGTFGFEYYASNFGLFHRETPQPQFDRKWLDEARKKRESEESESKRKEEVKKSALSKLSEEERTALGV